MPALLLRTALLAALAGAALAPARAQVVSIRPGAPGQPSRVLAQPDTVETTLVQADVRFMQGMIHHHAQALEMTALARTRTTTPALLMLAERIDVSQHDEIGWMQRWLRERGQDVPDVDAALGGEAMDHAAHHAAMQHDAPGMAHAMMPGMLTPDEMALLENATGRDFDRLFLQYMIRHHEGGLLMVADLLAEHGGAQAPDVYHIITDIDADQRADIQRMLAMLDVPPLPSILRRN